MVRPQFEIGISTLAVGLVTSAGLIALLGRSLVGAGPKHFGQLRGAHRPCAGRHGDRAGGARRGRPARGATCRTSRGRSGAGTAGTLPGSRRDRPAGRFWRARIRHWFRSAYADAMERALSVPGRWRARRHGLAGGRQLSPIQPVLPPWRAALPLRPPTAATRGRSSTRRSASTSRPAPITPTTRSTR